MPVRLSVCPSVCMACRCRREGFLADPQLRDAVGGKGRLWVVASVYHKTNTQPEKRI